MLAASLGRGTGEAVPTLVGPVELPLADAPAERAVVTVAFLAAGVLA